MASRNDLTPIPIRATRSGRHEERPAAVHALCLVKPLRQVPGVERGYTSHAAPVVEPYDDGPEAA